MKKTAIALALSACLVGSFANAAERPTIVLVHGAFADSSSWNGVIKILESDGLVGHSYGGLVISEAAKGHENVASLVYVAAFAPETGESALALSGKFPGSTLGPTLAPPVILSDGGKDLYIQQDKFPEQFAADVVKKEAQLMAVAQRPVTEAALSEPAGEPAWKKTPAWFVYGDKDKNIPPQALGFMAERAHSKQTVVVKGASHVVMISHPREVAEIIEKAATAKSAATRGSL